MPNRIDTLPNCLFVDDEPGVLKALKRALRSEPLRLRFAPSGQEALHMLAQQAADVVVTDMHMPEMSGSELLARVAEQYPHAIRLVLSGDSGIHDVLNAINDGQIYRYILKPWDDLELRATIGQALQISRLQAEKRRLVRRLKQHNRDLEHEVQARTAQLLKIGKQAEIGKYASQIVHDLNNPLHAVTSIIDLLHLSVSKGKPLDGQKLTTWLDLARKSTDDLTTIVSGILLHVREQSQSPSVAVDLNALIRQELKFFSLDRRFLAEVQQETCLTEGLPSIQGQPVQLKQVIDNLIRNAWDAMAHAPEGQLSLQTSESDGLVVMRVADTGQGIAPQNLARIFEPDFTTKPVGQGTGLGLASVKTMIESYGGTIEVDSTPGKGTTFTVKLPPDHQKTTAAGDLRQIKPMVA